MNKPRWFSSYAICSNNLRVTMVTMGVGLLGIVALSAACARKPPTAAETVAKSALRFLPKETAGVAAVEASRMEDRAALTRWLGEATADAASQPGYAAIRGILGADFLQQIDRATVALVPDPAAAAPPGASGEKLPAWTLLLEGRFDPKTIASIGPEGTLVTLFEVSGGPEVSLLSLPGKALAVGPRAALEKVKNVTAHPDAGLTQAPLLAALGKVAGDAQAWGAIDYPPLTELARGAMGGSMPAGASMAPILGSRAGSLKSVAFEARIATGVDFTLVGVASDTEGAKRLGDAARGLVALARMGAGQKSDKTWFDFLDGLRVAEEKSAIRLTGNLTRPMMEAFLSRVGDAGLPGGGAEATAGTPAGPAASGAAPNPATAPPAAAPAARP